jgi:leucyl aminopeptidase
MNGVVMFSIAGTLGALMLPDGQVSRARLEPHPRVAERLRQLHDEGVSIGVEIPDGRFDSHSVAALLESAGLLGLVEQNLILESPFAQVMREGPAVFVSRDRVQRARAAEGFRRVPDPTLVRAALLGDALYYIRARAGAVVRRETPLRERFSWAPLLGTVELAPLRVTVEGGHPVLYAVAGEAAIQALAGRVSVERLGAANLPERTDLLLLQTSLAGKDGEAFRRRLEQLPLFLETPGGILIALDAGQPAGAFHPPDDAHGHTRALLPSEDLLSERGDAPVPKGSGLDEKAKTTLATLDAQLLTQRLAPWVGTGPAEGGCGAAIKSRFLYHPDNGLAVDKLVCELKGILGSAEEHEFTFAGARHNVFADLPGATPDLVVVSAHLDATAARDGGCSLPADTGCIAPGADDDASGIAAVLSAAAVLKQLADEVGQPQRTIRFVLFNAEEQGMLGSEAYAAHLAAGGRVVRAVFQLDMIGTPGLGQPAPPPGAGGATGAQVPWTFEIHTAGWEDLGYKIYPVNDAQQAMGAALEAAAALLSPSLAVQHFPVPGCDRDPASGRSDHTSFQLQGFPACYVSEALWTQACPGDMLPHPTYHRAIDTQVDVAYAAAIARAVAGAAWLIANP